jgi:hypothetical protein
MIHTYKGDGNPLPPFEGKPRTVPIRGGIEEVADTWWEALNEDNKIALMVKSIGRDGVVEVTLRNKLNPQEAPAS